ncbi:hypothetical protein HALLA_14010 [Halostagnicola larsenii XH-48]|uniref:Uncharacterized protein n=1 Tax=Halostagnicola larsenii XH-48 TaxID=797299 RepID=W0JQN0_9EURY|nr:hypothetical protein HALLA_14010 [Halostagnicola larsenii XH-48]
MRIDIAQSLAWLNTLRVSAFFHRVLASPGCFLWRLLDDPDLSERVLVGDIEKSGQIPFNCRECT